MAVPGLKRQTRGAQVEGVVALFERQKLFAGFKQCWLFRGLEKTLYDRQGVGGVAGAGRFCAGCQ